MASQAVTLKQDDIQKLSFEDALTHLEALVDDMEQGAIDLEGSVKAYETGVLLKKHCESKLQEAQLKVEKISISDTGAITKEPFE